MVDFSQFRNTEDVPNFTARSQGVNMPDWGTLAANLGKSLTSAAEVYGTVKGQEAEASVADAVAQERINVGMDFAADEDPNVPADLNNRLERIQRASKAASKAGMGLSQYYNARLNALARDARAKYPGFGSRIDAALVDAAGYDFRKEAYTIQKELDKEQRTEERESTARDRTFASSSSFVELLPMMTPEQFANLPEGEDKDRIRMAVRSHESELAQIDTMKKRGIRSKQQYQRFTASKFSTMVTKVDDYRQKISTGDPSTAQEAATALMRLRDEFVAQMAINRAEIIAKEGSTLSAEDAASVENQYKDIMDTLIKSVSAGDPNYANIIKGTVSWYQQNSIADVWRKNGQEAAVLYQLSLLPQEMQKAVTEKIINEGKIGNLTARIAAVLMGSASSDGYKASNTAFDNMENPLATPEENNANFRAAWEAAKEAILVGDASWIDNAVKHGAFKSEKLAEYANQIDDDPVSFFNFISDQRVFGAIKKTGNKELMGRYFESVNYAFRNNTKIRESIMVDINKEANKYGKLVFNPETGSLSFARDKSKTVGMVRREGRFPFERRIEENLAKVNTFIQNQYNIQKEIDPDTALSLTQRTLDEIGLQYETDTFSAGETTSLGTQTTQNLENVAVLEDGTQVTPTSGTTTRAEFLGVDKAVGDLYEDKTNVDTAVKTAWGEGRGETPEGRIAIFEVLRNRALASGRSIDYEAKKGNGSQFNVWREKDDNYKVVTNFNEKDPNYETTVQEFLTSANSDITKGATHYYNPDTSSPPWENLFVETARIGKHRFGYLKKDDPYRKRLSKYRDRSEFD